MRGEEESAREWRYEGMGWYGYMVMDGFVGSLVWLSGYMVVRLFGFLVVWMFGWGTPAIL
jgi:hypothetical protein